MPEFRLFARGLLAPASCGYVVQNRLHDMNICFVLQDPSVSSLNGQCSLNKQQFIFFCLLLEILCAALCLIYCSESRIIHFFKEFSLELTM